MSRKRPPARRELLLNGRRVRITDLIDADRLKPGQRLYFTHRIGETPYEAVVTERGRLRLDDGREFGTPSAAAANVAGLIAAAGWAAGRISPNGKSLHQLRQELLKSVADEVATDKEAPEEEAEAARRRYEVLEGARAKAEAGEPESMTVREFIKLWGFEDRDRSGNTRIDADLANHGLTTAPDFRAVDVDRVLRMVLPPASSNPQSPSYFGDYTEYDPGCGIDLELLRVALVEFLQTGSRPTWVRWREPF